jgi:hypothetical protein
MKPIRFIKCSRAAICLVVSVCAASLAGAQCQNKTGFAKRACEVASHIPQASSGANPSAQNAKEAPLTTEFTDTLCLDTLPASIEPKAFKPLTSLERTDDGSFVLKTGIFEAYVQSYSLDPGEHTPNRVAGFYPAPIKGERAKVIGDVLKQIELHPDVPQSDVQQLLWAIVAGTYLEKMPPAVQQTAAKILTREMLGQVQGSVAASNADKSLLNMINRRLAGAQTKQSRSGQDSGSADTQSGKGGTGSQSQSALGEGPVVRGTWAQMSGGFYVRYLPEGYAKTRVQVIVSDAAVAKADSANPLLFDPTRFIAVNSDTPAQRLGITLRLVNAIKP